MNVRRMMKEMMLMSAIVKGREIEFRFHPDAPADPARLAALVDHNRATLRLTPSLQVIARLQPGEYEQVFAQLDALLQALAACENLESQSTRAPEVN
jgi:hypothetical protein